MFEPDKEMKKVFEKCFGELEDFFELDWSKNRPVLVVIEDLGVKYERWGKDAPKWLKGWCDGGRVFVLSRKLIKEEEGIDFDMERWIALIKHELSHLFFGAKTGLSVPRWLNEGLAIYVSGQNKWKKPVEKFEGFLEKQERYATVLLYRESGFAVEMLVREFGKKKMLELLERIQVSEVSEDGFGRLFVDVYGFDLGYGWFDERIKSSTI